VALILPHPGQHGAPIGAHVHPIDSVLRRQGALQYGRRLMRFVVAFCAVLVGVGCGPALSAPARTSVAAHPFAEVVVRPPASIPHARPAHAPLPRPKPAAATAGTIQFPPVAPLE
jgi:hypothetical protein